MAYTFGGATGDDINWSVPTGWGSSGSRTFGAGWFYPTTLTAGRAYWGNSNATRLRIATTTSEVEWQNDRTTDAFIVSSGAGITTGKWWFIACLAGGFNTGPADEAAVWIGDAETPPTEVTMTLTAGTGNASSNSVAAVGNSGSAGALAFQGLVDSFYTMGEASNISDSLFASTSQGGVGADVAEYTHKRYVIPLWEGRGIPALWTATRPVTQWQQHLFFEGEKTAQIMEFGSSSASFTVQRTTAVNGATMNATVRCPHPWVVQPYQTPFVRRR